MVMVAAVVFCGMVFASWAREMVRVWSAGSWPWPVVRESWIRVGVMWVNPGVGSAGGVVVVLWVGGVGAAVALGVAAQPSVMASAVAQSVLRIFVVRFSMPWAP